MPRLNNAISCHTAWTADDFVRLRSIFVVRPLQTDTPEEDE
jgi:hypothetical protein